MVLTYAAKYKKELVLVCAALCLNSLFLWRESQLDRVKHASDVVTPAWLIEGYNFYKYGISNVVGNADVKIKNYKLFDEKTEDPVFSKVSIYDPIFYPAFCALFWKVLGSPSLLYLKILNILLFAMLAILLFWGISLLLQDQSKAFWCTLGIFSFLPLIYHNIVHVRDIYHYYFFVIFLYFSLTFVMKKKSTLFLLPGALLVPVCQWIRPSLLSSFVALTALLFLWACIEPFARKKIITVVSVFWLGSAVLFWAPFCLFNKATYGQYYIMPCGEALLSSLYETPFADGDFVEHTTGKFVKRKTGKSLKSGTREGDNLCLKLYEEYNAKFPFHKYKCMLLRLKKMLWYDLPWREYDPYKTTLETSRLTKIRLAFHSPQYFFEFFARLYMRMLLLLAYIGILLGFLHREYKLLAVMLIGVVFSSGYSWLFHIEDRVLAIHNWPFGLFAAYCLIGVYDLVTYYRKQKQRYGKAKRTLSSEGSV